MRARTVPLSDLRPYDRDSMFALFSAYYDEVDEAQFFADLEKKDRVILLESNGEITGFTTIGLFDFEHDGRSLNLVFSGDTIIRHDLWGHPTLSSAWLREAGAIASKSDGKPLYWLLIVKGHRTYRYLPAFGLEFVPHWDGVSSPELSTLREQVGRSFFGVDYDANAGVVRFGSSRGHLKPEWALASERERRLPQVDFFLRSNPGYACGDELLCLCPLTPENMRPYARRLFNEGWAS